MNPRRTPSMDVGDAPRPSEPTADDDPQHTEKDRLELLRSFGVIESGDRAFDRLTRLAADLCGTSMALVSLIDSDSQWYLSAYGVEPPPTSREDSFCRHELSAGEILLVPDARQDPRFAQNPVVTGEPWIRFYAGAPLITTDGFVLGRLCVLDTAPGVLTEHQAYQLGILADEVMAQLNVRKQATELALEVAARRESEAAAARSERLLRGVLAHPDTVIYAKDLEGRFILANTALDDLLNKPAGGVLGRRDDEVMAAEAANRFRVTDREVAQTGEQQVVIEHFPHRDGSVHEFRSMKFPLLDEDGKVFAVAGMSMDITAQSAAERSLRESESRWHQLFTGSPVGIAVFDEQGDFVEVNAAMCALLGRSETELIGHSSAEFTHPDDVDVDMYAMIDAAPDGVASLEKRYVRPDGDVRWVWLVFTSTPGPGGRHSILGHVQDITDRLASERAIKDSEANLTAVAEVVALIQSGDDPRQTIVNAGRDLAAASYACLLELDDDGRSLNITSATMPEVQGRQFALDCLSAAGRAFETGEVVFISEPASDPLSSQTEMAILGTGSAILVPARSGLRIIAVLAVGWPHRIANLDDRRVRVISMLADQAGVALRQVSLLNELETLALTDPLTNLPNRRSWDMTLGQLLMSTVDRTHPLSVALVDLDHFKIFNDTHGHAAGDELLRAFADHARSVIRTADTVARWGGEEFAVALPECQGRIASDVLERIRIGVPDGQTCSVGYATWDGVESAAELMSRVDTALYDAKRAGRDRIRLAEVNVPC